MKKWGVRILYTDWEIVTILLCNCLYLIVAKRYDCDNPLQNFTLPIPFQFLIVPVYLVFTYKHDLYFFMTYCCTRYLSERRIFLIRGLTLLAETALFYLPLWLIYWLFAIPARLPLGRTLAFSINIYVVLLQLGFVSAFLHQLTRSFLLEVLLYIMLIVDSAASAGALPLEKSFFYLPLFQPALKQNLEGVYLHLSEMVLGLLLLVALGWFLSGIRVRKVLK